jgi:hypothetical protein
MAPTKQQGPKEKFLKKLQSFSDILCIGIYFTMHGPINVKSPNNISTWQMGFNSAFKGLTGRSGAVSAVRVDG